LALALRVVVLAVLAPLLAACAGRPGADVLSPVAADLPGARRVTVYVATSRERSTTATPLFGDGISATLNFARYVISIPPNHVPTAIEWPDGARPDPATAFVTVEETPLDAASFMAQVAHAPRPAAPGTRSSGKTDIGVFVHGFNYSFQEALFRGAQMVADSNLEGAPVLFAWPSAGDVTGYVADKEAATASRDQLTRLLTLLGRAPGTGRIDVVAHSMGSWLTMEALRQMRLTGQNAAIARLGQVTLAAPDIDVDVFAAQIRVVGPLNPPLTVLVSPDDNALTLSSFLSGERERVGKVDVSDPRVAEAAAAYQLRVIDISDLPADDPTNHNRFVALAALYPQLAAGPRTRPGGVRNTGAFVFKAVGTTLTSPFRLAAGAVGAH
jgi:esterase/lipase superfamily enzyme